MTVIKRYKYEPGPCLHCLQPETEHPIEAMPRTLHNPKRLACAQYTPIGRMVEVAAFDIEGEQ